ncbi:MAG: hypothetical protein E2P05_07235 [Acidobacteria bacterium]|nr:MAG: hypothetical protein E2P05_07235 [Acidobacteriota bacterium]
MGLLEVQEFILRHKVLRVALGLFMNVWVWFEPMAWLTSVSRFVPRLIKYALVVLALYLIWLTAPAFVTRMVEAVALVPPMPASASWFALAVGVGALGAGFFLFGLAAVLYTSWYYITIARALDAQLAREFGATRKSMNDFQLDPSKQEATDGSFNIVDEKQAAFKEELDELKRTSGMGEEEYQDHLKTIKDYGVGTEV